MQPIDLHRYALSDPNCRALCAAFLPLIAARLKADCPRGKTFVFDFDLAGPVVFQYDGTYAHSELLAHGLGEADPALIWWLANHAKVVPQASQVVLLTTDTDLVPLYCLYHEHRVADTHAHWKRDNKTQWVDLGEMARCIERNMDLRTFALWCAFDCDFLEREWYAKGSNMEKVRDALLVAVERIRHAVEQEQQPCTVEDLFRETLIAHYRKVKDIEVEQRDVPERFRKPRSVLSLQRCREWYPTRVPTDERVKFLARRLEFTFLYWSRAHL